ncbi:MAG TPA: ion transporter [Thermoanaerobaculia bacterium]
MTAAVPSRADDRTSVFQLVMVVLSLYVIVALIIEGLLPLAPATAELLRIIDTAICFVFLADFGVRFARAESKWKFMRWGWIDLLASIPMLDGFRWARLVRVVRVLRAFRSVRVFVTFFLHKRAESALAIITSLVIALMIFGCLAMLNVERASESNIRTPSDVLWWSLTTITTVGYGDRYPVTTEGRVIAVLMMIGGATLFSTFTAFIATKLLEPASTSQNDDVQQLIEEVRLLRQELERHGIAQPRDAERRAGA